MTPCSGRKCAMPIAALSNRVGLTRCARCIRASGSRPSGNISGMRLRDAGLRIDHLLLSPTVAGRFLATGVDRDVRGRDPSGRNRQNVAGVFLRLEFRIAAITLPKGGRISRVSIARIPRSGLVQQRLFKAALDELAVIGEPSAAVSRGCRAGAGPACRAPRPRDQRHARETSAGRRSAPPSRPNASDRLAEGAAGAAAERSQARTSAPSAAPFHRRSRPHARRAVPRHRGGSG
jgi:hypothetical protein